MLGTSVETVCHSHGITDEALQAAEYKPAEKAVLGKVLNNWHIQEIGEAKASRTVWRHFYTLEVITYAGGLQLVAVDVLVANRWSVQLYKHKTM